MLPNYIQYRYDLFRQKRSAKELEKKAPPESEHSHESGEMQNYHHRVELSDQWRALIQTDYYRRKSESLLIEMPDIDADDMYRQVDYDDHPDQPYYLTSKGLKFVKAAIREEQKHSRERFSYWFGIAIGLIGALTGLVSAYKP